MGSPAGQSLGRTVLIVDDDDILRSVLSRALADEGYPVLTAGNGEEALAFASALNGQLGLVVTDIRMPVMDGLELAAHLARLQPPPPVLFISGFVPANVVIPGPLLPKPFRPHDFVDQVCSMLQLPTPRG